MPGTPPPAHAQGGDALYAAVYDELKRLARVHLKAGADRATLNTTELVHEAFLKLAGGDGSWESRAHFFGAASRAMRQVLVDFARRRPALKRGGPWHHEVVGGGDARLEIELDHLLDLDRALGQLDDLDSRLCQVVELRFFGGVPEQDIARMLGVSVRTIERDWLKARLFLRKELNERRPPHER